MTTFAYRHPEYHGEWWSCDARTAAECLIAGWPVRLMTFDELLYGDTKDG